MLSLQEIKAERVERKCAEAGKSPSLLRLLRPSIDLRLCEKNYNCVASCPRNAISVNQKGQPVVDYGLCDGCLICLRECPTSAIAEERERK